MTSAASPPRAARRPHRHEKHGDIRIDDYYWLRERGDPEVRAYLEAENAYVRKVMASTADLEQRLFEEIKGRIKQTDVSVPYREGGVPLLPPVRGRERVRHLLPTVARRYK